MLATKVHDKMHDGPGGSGLSRKAILEQLDASLARLGTDYIDLYQIHRFDDDVPVEETMEALRVGVPPVQIREAIYQLAPFIGFPRTLNAVATINDVFADHGIELPLPDQGTVSDADRYQRGLGEQMPLYGNEIKDNLADLPEPFDEALPRFLTEFCFGDFYTRGGLTVAQRELLVLCALATIGDTAAQLGPHGRACLQVGNTKTEVVAALVHCFPYIGFPRSVAGVRAVKDL